MKSIPLSKGQFALVDDEDFEHVSAHKWCFVGNGYAATSTPSNNRVKVYLHRLIMNAPADMQVDHINGNKLDNRRENLRLASPAENQRNMSRHRDGSSRYKGVSFGKITRRWRSQIRVNNKYIHLGWFGDEADAARAYDVAAKHHFGEFAQINFPENS